MYIPIGPSKKQLYKIIIAMLLLLYLIFLGMYKPKAESLSPSILQYYKPNRTNNWTRTPVAWTHQAETLYATSVNTTNDIAGMYGVVNNQISGSYFIFQALIPPQDYWVVGQLQLIDGSIVSCDTKAHTSSNSEGDYYAFGCETIQGVQVYKYGIYLENQYGYAQTENAFSLSKINGFESKGEYNSYLTTVNNSIQNASNQAHQDSQQQHQDLQNINDTLNDSSIDSSSANNLTNNSAFQDSNGLDAIIKAPLNFIQSLTSSTCSAISLTIPYIDANVSLPCMSTIYTKALGQQLVNLIALVINGVVLYRYCLKILQLVHTAKNPNKDELEVLDL